MNPTAERLIRLQAVDERIALLLEATAALPRHLATIEQKLESQKKALAGLDSAIKAEEVKKRSLEGDIKDQQVKIAKYRDQLTGVKTNEQYSALQHEITFSEEQIKKLEDAELQSIDRAEKLTATRNEAQAGLAEQAALVDAEKAAAQLKSAKQNAELTALRADRLKVRHGIEEVLLANYDRISSGKKTALAPAQGQQCTACQMWLRPQMWNMVRVAEVLLTCESCGRLMYHDPAKEPAPVPKPEPKPKKRAKKVAAPEETASAESAGESGDAARA
jgi:predicted  nucleic acid-binding Zn-ribbon protein